MWLTSDLQILAGVFLIVCSYHVQEGSGHFLVLHGFSHIWCSLPAPGLLCATPMGLLAFPHQHHGSLCPPSYTVNMYFPHCCLHGKQTEGIEAALRAGSSRESGMILKGSLFWRQKVTASMKAGGSGWVGRRIGHMPGQSQVSCSKPQF